MVATAQTWLACRVVNDAVHSTPATSDADVADILRGVLRNVSMGSEDFESAVTNLLRTISSTSSSGQWLLAHTFQSFSQSAVAPPLG